MPALLAIAVLVVLVLVHELGHFSVAKLFGIRVDQFNIGFPPRLIKIQKGETLYSFNLLLLGGYVQIHGEDSTETTGDPRALSSKPRPVQALVLLAGIASNLVFAWLLLSAGYMAGLPTAALHEGVGVVADAHPMITSVLPRSPAEAAGLAAGDTVLAIDTAATHFDAYGSTADATHAFITAHAGESLVMTVVRDGEHKAFLARAQDSVVPGQKIIGVVLDDVGILRLPPHLALWEGGILAKNIVVQMGQGLAGFAARLADGRPDFSHVAGPVGIVSLGGAALKGGLSSVFVLAASISISLALFNLLPIPGLDGGRLLIVAAEAVMRRPVPPRVMFFLTVAGVVLILALFVVVTYHDIARLVG
jgi:regulator of sigma E protease